MCGGVCGPAGESNESNSGYWRQAPKKITQRKTPYQGVSGTVLACWEGQRMFVQLYRYKNKGGYGVSWSSVLSSGAAGYARKENAVREYNKHVPRERRI